MKKATICSWLEATPTIYIHHIAPYVHIAKKNAGALPENMWERHLAAMQ